MEKTKLKESLEKYFECNLTDYAVMISGEWGIGKTCFLKSEVYSIIKRLELRPIYVSLIGIKDVSHLEKLIFQKINPFYNHPNKTTASREADYIESIINNLEKPDIIIPENLVLFFDDLERINPEFFESAMGFINVFIEHYKTKCVFLCNEDILIKNISTYKNIKEKYIRYTYSFTPQLGEVLKTISLANTTIHLNNNDKSTIVDIFKKGKTHNLRTLFYSLSIFEQCLLELDKLPDTISHKDDIKNLMLTYCCFYVIETKKGTPHELLDKITIARKPEILMPDIGAFIESTKIQEDEEQINELTRLERIQQNYFSDTSLSFERFVSIAEFIKEGYLNSDLFKNEIVNLSAVLNKREQRNNVAQLVNMLDNVYKYSDRELHNNIGLLVNEVKKGSLSLVDYLKLYQNLVWLESLRIKGVNVDDTITQSFMEGAEKAFQTGELKYIQNLKFQFQWNNKDKSDFAKKFNDFADYLSKINDRILIEKKSGDFENIITAIIQNNHEDLFKLLSANNGVKFSKNNAIEIHEALTKAHSNTTNEFLIALNSRYKNDHGFYSQILESEKEFIKTLFDKLSANTNLTLETEKSLNEVELMFLKNYLKELIDNQFPEDKQI